MTTWAMLHVTYKLGWPRNYWQVREISLFPSEEECLNAIAAMQKAEEFQVGQLHCQLKDWRESKITDLWTKGTSTDE